MFLPRGDGGTSAVLQPCFLMSLGITESFGEKRIPRLEASKCEEMLRLARIGDEARVVLFTDGGSNPACPYRIASSKISGIVQQEGVDHSGKQYARACLRKGFLTGDGSYTWVPGVAGDNRVEGAWKQLVSHMDCNVAFDHDVALEMSARYAQWRFMISVDHPWLRYLAALRLYPSRLEAGTLTQPLGSLGERVLTHLRGWSQTRAARCPVPRHRDWHLMVKNLASAGNLLQEMSTIELRRVSAIRRMDKSDQQTALLRSLWS